MRFSIAIKLCRSQLSAITHETAVNKFADFMIKFQAACVAWNCSKQASNNFKEKSDFTRRSQTFLRRCVQSKFSTEYFLRRIAWVKSKKAPGRIWNKVKGIERGETGKPPWSRKFGGFASHYRFAIVLSLSIEAHKFIFLHSKFSIKTEKLFMVVAPMKIPWENKQVKRANLIWWQLNSASCDVMESEILISDEAEWGWRAPKSTRWKESMDFDREVVNNILDSSGNPLGMSDMTFARYLALAVKI